MLNHSGFIAEPIAPEDFVFGSDQSLAGKFSGEPLQKDSNWKSFLPIVEKQAPGYETQACVSFGTLSAIEILSQRIFKDGSNLSDRMVAKESGTNPNAGNTPKRVAEYIRKKWSVLEAEWPTNVAKTVQEFYAEIPAALKTLAIGRGAEFSFGYEYVGTSKANIREALKYSPLGISVPAWATDGKRFYRPDGMADNHWTVCYGINDDDELLIFDTYEPHLKVMRADFTPAVAMGYHLERQTVKPKSWFLQWIEDLIAILFPKTPEPVTVPVTVPSPQAQPTVPPPPPDREKLLLDMCYAIREHEGWFPESRSWRNNNPGNCRYSSVGYAKMYEPVRKDPQNFAIFKDYETGWKYLRNLVLSKAKDNPDWSLSTFFKVYAPASDGNDPVRYASLVAKKMGVSPFDWQLRNLI